MRTLFLLGLAGAALAVPAHPGGSAEPRVAPGADVGPAAVAKGAIGAHRAAVTISRRFSSRAAGGKGERRAQAFAARHFRAAGLRVEAPRFRVPGRGRSRNVIAVHETPRECLTILMAHIDGVPPGRAANDNASGVGALIGLAPRISGLDPECDVWLVATGAEERVVIGTGYHVGAAALVRIVRRRGRAEDLRLALSVDMVGRGKRFHLRSPNPRARGAVEGRVLAAARRAGVRVRWARDSGSGNSDHREFELAGLPAAVMQVWRGHDPCRHEACDGPGRLQGRSLSRAQRVLERLLAG